MVMLTPNRSHLKPSTEKVHTGGILMLQCDNNSEALRIMSNRAPSGVYTRIAISVSV